MKNNNLKKIENLKKTINDTIENEKSNSNLIVFH